jgi:hypothetical protein
MQTFPFYEHHTFVSSLPADELMSRLSGKFAEETPTDEHFIKGKTKAFIFKFHRVIASGSRNSFNPICYGEVIPGEGKKATIHIKMRIAYPIYILWIIIFSMTVFGHITLTYGSFQTDGVTGVLFATGIMALFYGAHYLFYQFGFKRSTKKTTLLLAPYLDLRPIKVERR